MKFSNGSLCCQPNCKYQWLCKVQALHYSFERLCDKNGPISAFLKIQVWKDKQLGKHTAGWWKFPFPLALICLSLFLLVAPNLLISLKQFSFVMISSCCGWDCWSLLILLHVLIFHFRLKINGWHWRDVSHVGVAFERRIHSHIHKQHLQAPGGVWAYDKEEHKTNRAPH